MSSTGMPDELLWYADTSMVKWDVTNRLVVVVSESCGCGERIATNASLYETARSVTGSVARLTTCWIA